MKLIIYLHEQYQINSRRIYTAKKMVPRVSEWKRTCVGPIVSWISISHSDVSEKLSWVPIMYMSGKCVICSDKNNSLRFAGGS